MLLLVIYRVVFCTKTRQISSKRIYFSIAVSVCCSSSPPVQDLKLIIRIQGHILFSVVECWLVKLDQSRPFHSHEFSSPNRGIPDCVY
jgi:hypothetical protein